MDLRLYSKAKALANPFAYAEYRQKLINDKLEKERESRIRTVNKGGAKAKAAANGEKITVNKGLVERLQTREEKEKEKERRKRKRTDGEEADEAEDQPQQPSLLTDDRFSNLFTNPEFAIDESSKEFAMLNPSAAAQKKQQAQDEEEREDSENSEEDADDAESDGDSDSSAEGGMRSI